MISALGVGGVTVLVVGLVLGCRERWSSISALVQAVGLTLVGAAGLAVLLDGDAIGAQFTDAIDPSFGVDGLSGFFLLTTALVGVPALVYARDYLAGGMRAAALTALTGLFLLSLIGFVAARDPSTFLGFWELITLIPAIAILVRNHDESVRRAVFVYLAITHVAGVGVWISILALAHFGALSDPGTLLEHGTGVQTWVIVAALIGFGTKAGLMPLHSWLPRAHPVAPAHFSALMSGVMIKVAIYGLVRVLFEWAAPAPEWCGLVVLALGLLSALGGVVYALFQHDLKRLLAFHSIENVGIIALGIGASILFAAHGSTTWAALAFAAALLHTLNHAIFKGLLFLGAGSFERAVGSLDLDRLGGLLRRMPWTGAAFLIGSMAIAGVPPLNGFASEWLTLQALVHLAIDPPVGLAVVGALAAAGLAATAALAVYCFVKVVGLVLLGAPRRPEVEAAGEVAAGMRWATALLASFCVLLGIVPGLLVGKLLELAPEPAQIPAGAGLSVPGTGSLPSPSIALGLALLIFILWRVRGARRAAPVPAWACGQPVEPEVAWTSSSFTKPLRLVLEVVLRPRREITTVENNGLLQRVDYRGEVPHLFDTHGYEPLLRAALAAAAFARRLQSGNVRTYAAYLLGLLLLALLAIATGVIG